jgi:hypothetical protein
MDTEDLLVGGKTFKDKRGDDYCYLPIFQSDDLDKTQWVFGAKFM